jgi:predicted DNA-binding transcriptional regulator AlpA
MNQGTAIRDEAKLLDVPAAAALLGMSHAAVRQAVYRGELPARRFGRSRVVFVRAELVDFIRNLPRRQATAPPAA